jgi:alanine dehydrogenase
MAAAGCVKQGAPTMVLTREAIARLLLPAACLEAVRGAYCRLMAGEIEISPVGHLAATDGGFHIKSALSTRSPRRAVIKMNSNFPQNPQRSGLPVIQGMIALFDADCGALLALMDSAEITARRTAASSALAAQLLARRDSGRLALIGCGVQARHHLEALSTLFPLREVALFDTSSDRMKELAESAAARGLAAETSASISAATRGADIIVTTTPSQRALLDLADVSPGCFIAAVGADSAGKQELTPELMRKARVVPDILAQAATMGDLQHALARGTMTARDIHAELGEIVVGRAPARCSDADIFVFDSTGTALADLAAAEIAFELASNGRDVPQVRLSA